MSTTSLITFAEFELLPDIEGKRELVDGEIITMPPPELFPFSGRQTNSVLVRR